VTLRPMTADDLPLLVEWFARPHVQRWWHQTPDLEQTRAKYLPRIAGNELTAMVTVLEDGRPIGLAQHYAWDDYADDRDNYRIGPGELGLDYTIGELTACHRGLGTQLIGQLLDQLRAAHPPRTPVSVTPEAANQPSRRILEKNGFSLVEIRQGKQLPGRAPEGPTAVYRRQI
jgi:RimJ/RimL family protein N-acetyltransferase